MEALSAKFHDFHISNLRNILQFTRKDKLSFNPANIMVGVHFLLLTK